jgi:hypothetical protein
MQSDRTSDAAPERTEACEESAALRPPPELFRVPPPAVKTGPTRALLWSIAAVQLVLALVLLVLLPNSAAGLVFLCALPALAALVHAVWRRERRHNAARDAFLKALGDDAVDPLGRSISEQWARERRVLKPNEILAALADAPRPTPPRARIVVAGAIHPPEVGDFRFEPVIIAPTQYLGKRLALIPIPFVLLSYWLVAEFRVLPIPLPRVNLSGFGYVIAMGIGALIAWFWRSVVRPTYIRLAPGIVQVMTYRFGGGKPAIRSFPMKAGTVAIVAAGPGQTKASTLTLARGEELETLPLALMRNRDEITERLCQAILSTAPTPPLSDEELVG